MKTIQLTSFVIMCLLSASQATADEDLLDALLKNGGITQEQYDQLKRQQQKRLAPLPDAKPAPEEMEPVAKEPQPAPPETEAGGSAVEVITQGALRGRTRDGDFTFQLGGRLQADGAVYDSDAADLGDGSEIRRARLAIEGTVWRDWNYELEFDFAENEAEIEDAWLEYTGFEAVDIKVGNFKEPFSLEEQTSSKHMTFMERALPNVFAPGRNLGVGAHSWGERWSAKLGIFGEDVDSNDDEEQDEGYGITGRFVFLPVFEEARLIHLGAAGGYRATGDDNEVRFRARPESHVTNVRLVNTDNIGDVEDISRIVAESALVWGPFSVQGEYMWAHLNRDSGLSNLNFNGYYLYGSWFLTGESRTYDLDDGRFTAVLPRGILGRGGYGAWELAVRYSTLDLDDADIQGGDEDNYTVGLNWYPTRNIRFAANYVRADSKRQGVKDDPNIFQLRAQIAFE